MKKLMLIFMCLVLTGCSSSQVTGTWYGIEAVGLYSYNRTTQSNDVVLVKGKDGIPNRVYMRRGWNKLWGPSPELKMSGLGYWDYVEKNRRIQIYENIGVAMYGKYAGKFEMTKEVAKKWIAYEKWMSKKYPKQVDYAMYEHLLRKKAKIAEATSEYKQELYHFKHRNDKE